MIKLVIFDFDGTVVDSKTAYYNSISKHLIPKGFSKKQVEDTIDLGLNLGETLKKFIPSWLYRWGIRRKIMKDVLKEANLVKKCHDASKIEEITAKKILVSNSLSEFVVPVLKHLKLRRLFKEVYCADDFDEKTLFMQRYLKVHGIRPYECFYVGDRIADVKLAKKIKCYSAIVYGKCSWNSKKELMGAKPDFIIPGLADLKRILDKFRG
ncbi:MAG TPA: HAD hydrolase-like protein [Candidatus Nanoarchaeia archaeon]|nr:HAD hydrolase-like protein [Candidatus Nanoarchaeia archaeon]